MLNLFYTRIQPDEFWQPVANRLGIDVRGKKSQLPQFLSCWLLGIGLGYACLFGIGQLIFADWTGAIIYGIIAALCAGLIN